LEHAALSAVVDDKKRTAVFARYSLVGSLLAAFGSLAAALPTMMSGALGLSTTRAIQSMFVLYALLAGVAAIVYRGLPTALGADTHHPTAPLTKSKRTVFTFVALFSLDAFGGGFVVQSMVALWLYQKFALSLAAAGTIFF
jgi:hypothetical protein